MKIYKLLLYNFRYLQLQNRIQLNVLDRLIRDGFFMFSLAELAFYRIPGRGGKKTAW